MTRHGRTQPSATGTQPAATDPHASMVIIDADRTVPSHPPGREHRAEAQQSGLSASIAALPDDGRAIANVSQNSKSP